MQSTTEVLDSDGEIKNTFQYTPYGILQSPASSMEYNYQYAGYFQIQDRLPLSAGARFYASAIGRWLSRDPIEENSDVNLYRYCLNRPNLMRDPTGFQTVWGGVKQLFGSGQYYKNWGGNGWANGRKSDSTTTTNFPHTKDQPGFEAPLDKMDYCFYVHDICLHNAARIEAKNVRKCYRGKCDKDLSKCLREAHAPFKDWTFWAAAPNGKFAGDYAPDNEPYIPDPPDPLWN